MVEAAEQKNTTIVALVTVFLLTVLSEEKVAQSPFFCSPVVPKRRCKPVRTESSLTWWLLEDA